MVTASQGRKRATSSPRPALGYNSSEGRLPEEQKKGRLVTDLLLDESGIEPETIVETRSTTELQAH